MDLIRMTEHVVQQEELALQLGMAAPSRFVLDELSYRLQEVLTLRGKLEGIPGETARSLRNRLDSVTAEMSGLRARWSQECRCALCAA